MDDGLERERERERNGIIIFPRIKEKQIQEG